MSVKQTISQILERELDHDHYFVVGVHADASERNIQVYIDGTQGVDIGYCARLSRTISRQIDEMDMDSGAFRFEISSPGADKPLVDIRQYPKHVGRELEVLLKDDQKVTGQLLEVDEDGIRLKVTLDKKKKLTEERSIPIENITHSTVIISFKSVKK